MKYLKGDKVIVLTGELGEIDGMEHNYYLVRILEGKDEGEIRNYLEGALEPMPEDRKPKDKKRRIWSILFILFEIALFGYLIASIYIYAGVDINLTILFILFYVYLKILDWKTSQLSRALIDTVKNLKDILKRFSR